MTDDELGAEFRDRLVKALRDKAQEEHRVGAHLGFRIACEAVGAGLALPPAIWLFVRWVSSWSAP